MKTLRAVLSLAPALLLALPTAGVASGRPADYSLLQLNLCLSGFAGCYADTEYPAVVDEAISTIETTSPDAVTLNEACSGDVARIAEETGYDVEFATVIYNGGPLPCKLPGERGVFGNAVLTAAPIDSVDSAAYETQQGSEERRWLCVTTTEDVNVCTTHLAVGSQPETNQAQCLEFQEILAGFGRTEATIAGGDFNRATSCAPAGFWSERDEEAAQAPGIQHIVGSRPGLVNPRDEVIPMTYTDHDGLLVHAMRIGS